MNKKLLVIGMPAMLTLLYCILSSSSGGINGQSQAGCTCHGTASPSTLVTINGLPAGGYTNGAVYPITVSVTNTVITSGGSFGLRDGFNMTATAGTFTAIAGTAINGATEIRHSTPKAPVSGTASWTFNWTAPASGNANVSFYVSGNATNGNGTSAGDMWNQTNTTIIKAGTPLTAGATNTAITCNGSTSTITASGVGGSPGYQYRLNAGSFQASTSFAGNAAGTYTITVRDATLATASTLLTITQPSAITVSATAGTIACNAGTTSISASASGGTGTLNYRLNSGTYQVSGTFNAVAAGTYTITARDANLCTKTTTVVITQPTALSFTAPVVTAPTCNGGTGSAQLNVLGGTGTKTYTINPLGPQSNTTGLFTGLTAQVYTATATDGNNCTKTISFTMTQPAAMNWNAPVVVNADCGSNNGSVTLSATGGSGSKTYTIVPLGPQSNSTGIFSGLSGQVYTITATDANSCTKTTTVTVGCLPVLEVKLFSQGFYLGASQMAPVLNNQGFLNPTTESDSVMLELHQPAPPYTMVFNTTGILLTNGTITWKLPPASYNNSYYLVVRHRNMLETWSQTPITLSGFIQYNFSTSLNNAFGANQLEVEPGVFAFYSGDLNQDGVVDGLDFNDWETDNNNFAAGFFSSDFNGDGIVDGLDFLIWEPNNNNFIGTVTP